jgi:Zn-dependent protease with chaperone function
MSSKPSIAGLQADAFRHPLDRQATQSLRQIPGLDLLIRGLVGPTAEQVFYLQNLASSILVGPKQLPELHQGLVDACRILDIEVPQLYIRQNPAPNAYTFAMRGKQPFIVVHSSLIDLLTPVEVQAVIAHELGHLKCEHSVYLTIANILMLGAGLLPGGGFIAQRLQDQLMEWVRCAEFSCDRAALLVSQDPRVVASVMMKLTGGSPMIANQLNLDAFLDQARDYDRASESELGQTIRQMQTAPLSHPLPVLRAREIDRWATSEVYRGLIAGRTPKGLQGSDEGSILKAGPNQMGGWRNW